MEGSVEHAKLTYIVRDHSAKLFDSKLATLALIEKTLNEKYGEGTVKLTTKEQYRNMKEVIDGCYHVVENAEKACVMAGIEPVREPIRGGTDGARLSFMGLPCPNLGTGGFAFHGPYEHITAEGMDISVDVVMKIIDLYAE